MNADEFRLRAEAGEIPSVDPKLQTAARSGNRYAQREMERQMAAQQAEAERQAAIQARQAEMQAKQAARQTERDAVELQARNVRIGAAAGQKVVTDIETGKRSIATHPDGAPVYKTGPVGAPQITSVQPAGPMPDGGNITPVTEVKQTYRNDRGDTITSPVEQKTDPKTGQTYVERKDAYGRPQRVTTGVDPLAQQKLLLEQESAKLDIHGNNLRAQRMQIEPRIKAVEDEWKAAETDWNKPPKFIQQNGKWVDTATGMPADEQQRADWQRSQVGIEARYRSAKRRYEQESPALKNLEEQERQLTMRKLDLDTKRTALEHGLPAEDGGTAETLARQQTGQANPEHDQVMRDIASVPGMGAVIDLANNDQNWKPTQSAPDQPATPEQPTEKPLIPTDDEGKRALFINAFPGLRHAEQYTVGKTDKIDSSGNHFEWTWIQRNGENIGTLERDPKDGSPAFVLNQNLVQQGGLRDTIAMGTTTGIPIYLADTGKPKDQAAEAQYVASIFTALRDDPTMQDQTVAAARLKDMGADPASIMRKVQAGEMSVQRGETLMKNLYGGTLQASNPEDPATMQRWLQETKTRADKELQDKYGDPRLHDPNSAGRQWEAASTGIGTSATTKNQIRQDFLRDNYLENRGKPGVSRAKYLALHQQDLADSMTLGENVLSKLHAIGKSTRDDVLGSMIGLAGGAALSLGQAEFAILGDKRAAAQFAEDMRLRNRDFASWTNSAKRNLTAWTTPQGIKTAGEFGNAMTSLQRAIDADEESSTPETQAAVAAAEQRARQSALAMHNLAPDESWPTTSDDLDPAKDTALASALNGYRTTADPRFFSLYRDRMLMGNGRRQYSSELERKIGPSTGGFFSSMDHAMYAGWQEAASEVAADTIAIASGGASKAIQAGLKGIGMTARATRLGKFSASIAKGLSAIDELALAKGTLQRPLTSMQKARNIAVQGIKGAAGEGMEEVSTEIGAESPQLLQAFGSGMLGVVGLSPAMIVSHFVASTDMPQREMDRRNAKWANTYNATMQGTVGFQPITAEHANTARSFINPKAHQALVEGLTAQLQQIEAPQPLSPEQTSSLQQERQQLSSMIETHLDENNASLTPEALAGIEKRAAEIDAQLHPATDAGTAERQQQRAAIEQTLQQIATQTEDAITAARQVAEIKDPAERAFYSGLAKVATGNHALLTTAERKAIQGRKTAAGADYFAPVTMPDGQTIETITPEARAETLMNMPAIGRLIQTTESDALVAQQLGVTPESAQSDTPVQEGPNAIRLPATPEQKQQAATVVQTVMQRLQAEYPQLAARTSIAAADPQKVSGGVVAIPNADGTSSIGIIQEDIEHSLANGETPESMIEKTVDNIVLHETLHTLQFQIAGNNAESFYTDLYTQMTPEMLANGRELYGAANWDTLKEWQRAAEVVRMLAEAKIAGRTTDVHRLTAGADASLLARIAEVIKSMVEAIATGTVPESVKQHVDALTELYQELLNAPANDNTSTADPADRQQQPAPGETGDGNRQTAEADSNGPAPVDGGTEPAPSPDAGAPGFQPPSAELTYARKVTTEAFRRAIETKPILKKDADLLREVSDVAYQLAEQIAGLPEAEQKRAVENAINSFILSPEIRVRTSELQAEQKAKNKEYRRAAQKRLRAEARRIIAQKMEAIERLISGVGRITRPPNALALIARGETLPAEYNAALKVSNYTGGGKNAVAREIINMIWAPDENSGLSIDKAASGMETEDGKYANLTGDDMWQLFEKEIRGYVNGTDSDNNIYDPDAELTDDQVDAALAKLQADQTVEKWRELTGRQNLMRGEAMRLEEAYQRIVRDELGGVEPDDFTADDIYGRVIEESKQAQKPAAQPAAPAAATPTQSAPTAETRESLNKIKTAGSEAPLNDYRESKSKDPRKKDTAGLASMQPSMLEDPIDTAPLVAIQKNIPGITVPHTSGKEESIIGHATALGQGGKKPGMIPPFQGNKADMIKHVVAAALRYWTPAQREQITDVYDMFAGGGAWGTLLAKTLFPNVKRVHINEYDQVRSIKVRRQIENGHRFAEVIKTPEMQTIIRSIIEDYAAQADGKTWGAMDKAFTAWANANVDRINDDTIAVITMLADTPTRGAPWESKGEQRTIPTAGQITNWFLGNQAITANIIHQQAETMRQQGVEFRFYNEDAYMMDVAKGPSSFAIADPPYIFTTGYGGEGIVGPDTYAKTAALMERLKGQDTHIIYTDEAWWIKPELDSKVTDGAMADAAAISARIARTIDFTVVSDKIGNRRYETLGLYNPAGSPVAAGQLSNPDRNAGTQTGGDDVQQGRGGNGPGATGNVVEGTMGKAGIQSTGPEGLNDRLASAPSEQSKSIALLERHPKFSITDTSLDKRGLEERMRSRMQLRVGDPKDYVLRVVPTTELKPTQTGEDYENDSSRETARWIRETPASSNLEDTRWQDLLPVVADAKGNLDDGNHRHYAAMANGDSVMLAMVPKKSKLASYPAYQQDRLASAPIDPKNPFGEWSAPVSHPGVLIGYRGSKASSGQDNNFGGSEGIGLYLAKLERDAEFFGNVREVKFPEPKRPLVVDEDSGADIIPMLNEDAEDVWNHIFGHKINATDSEWIKAHVWAAKRIGLTEDTWSEKIDQFPRALTDMLLKMGYDAVYVRSGGMEWVNLLAKEGQRFNRGTRSETGAALYSAPSTNPAAQYRYLKAKQEKAGLTTAEQEALLRAELDMGQSFAFDMDRRTLAAPRGSVTPRFQPFLRLEQESAAPPAEQLALFSPAVGDNGRPAVHTADGRKLEAPGMILMSPAWHGTPHKVDKFSLDKIGTGEGAQAYGWGLYFAENRDVAQGYSEIAPRGGETNTDMILQAKEWLVQNNIDTTPYTDTGWTENLLPTLAEEFGWDRPGGNLYKVDLKPAEDEYLDWDKPLSKQSEKVKTALQKAGIYTEKTPYGGIAKGEYAYHSEDTSLQRKSWRMQEIGIRGIRYLDGNSRSDGQGTYNYVIFDANDIEITEENGTPVSADALFSPAPAPDQQAADAALRNLPPLYREVFQASIADPKLTPEDLGRRFGIPARGAENIINQVRTRLRANTEAANDGLSPKGNSGRPDLGYSTVPSLQRVDQIRAQEGLPLQQTTEEIRGQAEALLRQPGSVRQLIDTTEDWTSTQTAAANIELVNRALQGRNDLETAELAAAYREQGSRWSETGRARRDVHRSPAERHAMLIADLLTVPDASTSSGLKKAKTKAERDAILAGWVARVKGIKEHMLARGVDLDEALQRLNQQMADAKASESEASAVHQQLVSALQQQLEDARINLKQAEQAAQDATDSAMKAKADAEATRAAQRVTEAEQATQQAQELDPANTIRLELRKLSIQHRAVVESMRDGATWEQAAATTGLTVDECRRVMQGFIGALRQAAIKTLTLAEDMLLGNTLASPALNAPAPENRQQRLGRMADAMIGAMGYDMGAFDKRSNPATAKTGKTKRTTETKQAKPDPAMMSDEEFARRQNNPDTHRALWQFESSLTRPSSRISFDEWMKRPETAARIERQTRMWQQPVSTTTGTLDMHDVKSVAAVRRELHASRAGLFDKVLEFWRQSILSGPQTAIVNTGSNIANSIYHLGPRRLIEAGVNDVLGILGQGNKDAATLGEIAAMTRHIHAALARAGRNMVMAWNNETRIAEYQFLALAQQTDFAGMKEDYIPPAIGGKFGTLMRSISFRHMTAADEFIKAFHGHLEAAAQAHRIAKQEGLSGAAYEARLTALMKEGSETWSRALAVAEDVTFQRKLNTKDPRAIAVLDKIASATKRASTRYKALSFFFPFVNTPTNIFKTAIEMSPVGGLLAVIDGARALKIRIARGNMTKEQARIAASELYDSARFVQDTTNQLIAAAVFWALSGLVDSGDDDESGLPRITGTTDWKSTRKGERDNQYRTMPPQSIRLGDGTIVSYSRIEPFATVLAGVVDLIHEMNVAGGLNEKALSAYMGRIQNQLDDKTFLAGVSDLINAYHDPERFSAKLAGNIVTGFVPNLIRQPIREADPYVRDTKPREEDGFLTAIGKQVGYTLAPGYAPPMLDVWGNPVTRHQGIQIGGPQTDILIRVFDPSNVSIGKQIDPVDRYIYNWNRATDVKNHLALEPIRDSLQVTIAGKPVKIPLTADEQAAANRAAGQAARRFLGDQWDWKTPTQEGIDRIKEIVQRFQNIERDKLRARKLREMR